MGLKVIARLKDNLPELLAAALYRLRHLHRGTHPVRTAMELVRLPWLSLGRPVEFDTS